MKHLLILSTALFAHICVAAEPLDLDTDTAKTNYSVGYQIGGDFKLEGLEMQPEVVIRGHPGRAVRCHPAHDARGNAHYHG